MSREILFTYKNNFSNDFINSQEGAADPFLIKVNGYYYLFFTASDGLICYRTFDLLHFEPINYNGHVEGINENIKAGYAPEVFYFNGFYYLICSPNGNGHFIFKSKNIVGPYIKASENIHEMIDGSFFIDSDEKIYLSRASETGIIVKEFNECKRNDTDFALFNNELVIKEAKVGRWNEGPFILKRYGKYYLTYTGTHFLSSAYRVEYVSGKSLNNLKYKDCLLLSTSKDYYGLGHSMNILGPNLDSDYIVYHSMNDDGIRRFNIARLLFKDDKIIVNNPSLNNNFNIERPSFETFTNNSNIIFDYETSSTFSIEFNLLGKEAKGIFGYKNNSSYYSLYFKNNEIRLDFNNKNLINIKLKRNYSNDVLHNFRIQYKDKRIAIYFDNIEFLINKHIVLQSGRIGYKNNLLNNAYIASSNYAFKSSDQNEVYVNKSFVYKDKKEYDFYIFEDGEYYLSILGKEGVFNIDFEFLEDKFNYKNDSLNKRIDLKIYSLKKGIYTLKIINETNVEYLILKKKEAIKKEVILENSLENISNFDIYHNFNVVNYGIYFENDRNVILSIDKFKDYEAETIVKLLGNPIETTDLVGLVSDVTNYGKDNSFESCYSLNGYIFGLNRKYIYVVLARFNHSKILFKHKIDNCKNEFKLKINKYNSIVKFYLDDKEIYKTIDNDIYIEGKIGIYNNHASGLFKYIKIKGE